MFRLIFLTVAENNRPVIRFTAQCEKKKKVPTFKSFDKK